MRKQTILIDEKTAYPLAKNRFIETCKFNLSTSKHQRMLKMGEKVREDGIDGINIKALVSFYEPDVFQHGKIKIENTEISCNYFQQIPDSAVEGIYFYILTAGECYFSSEENIMDFLYADIWGTNYVDAGIEILRGKIEDDMKNELSDTSRNHLSEEFGPGYFGMPILESKNFFEVLKGEEIGVRVKESGLMIPQKTCTGLYLVLNDPKIKAEPECMKCYGNKSGCEFCKIKSRMKEVQK